MNGSRRDANIYPIFQFVTEQVVSNLQKLFNTDTDFLKRDAGSMPTITGALSMALCYINRITKLDDEGYIKPRILVLSVSPDSAFQYIPLMNCIFSAQKAVGHCEINIMITYFYFLFFCKSIPVDVCKIYGEDNAFLQQASNITGGVYVRVDNAQALLEYLLVHIYIYIFIK